MTNMEDRAKVMENKYMRDKEQEFKVEAKRNRLLGLWAAEKLEKTGEEADKYALSVVEADMESEGHGDVIAKLLKDFYDAEVSVSEQEIVAEMERLLPIAREKVNAA